MPTSRAGGQALVGLVLAAAAIGALLAGRLAISILVGALSIVAYGELRGVLTPSTRAASLVVGAAAVAALLWAGYRGNLTGVPWIAAGCVLVLLAAWVVSHEVTGRPQGATEDVAGTIAAAAIVGVLGAHVLLIRAVPRVGFRGLLAFGLMVLCNDAAAFFGGRALGHRPLAPRLSPNKTAEGRCAVSWRASRSDSSSG
jgi:phosphatidate cytidylyltransferase